MFFNDNINDLINIFNLNVDHINIAFLDVFVNKNCSKCELSLAYLQNWFGHLTPVFVNSFKIYIYQQLKYNDNKDMKEISFGLKNKIKSDRVN
jgi:hypothetical protein